MDYREFLGAFNQFVQKGKIKLRVRQATFAYDEVRDYIFIGGISRWCFFGKDIAYFHQFPEGILVIFYEHTSAGNRRLVEKMLVSFSKETGIITRTDIGRPLNYYDSRTTPWATNPRDVLWAKSLFTSNLS